MREFFRGWRRKIGVVTLMMACVFMALWVRSQINLNVVTLPFKYPETDSLAPVTIDSIISRAHSVSWTRKRYVGGARLTGDPGLSYPKWSSISEYFERDPSQVKWRLHWCGFQICDLQKPNDEFSESNVSIPYWAVVLPLTLLSAYLLLSKPRPGKPPESTNPPDEAEVTHA
jgi:hypothetical protein